MSPPRNQYGSAPYNPQNYGPMPGTQAPLNGKPWTQDADGGVQSDTSRWGVNFNHRRNGSQNTETKPPLPVCAKQEVALDELGTRY